jgi:hypothetical protein
MMIVGFLGMIVSLSVLIGLFRLRRKEVTAVTLEESTMDEGQREA